MTENQIIDLINSNAELIAFSIILIPMTLLAMILSEKGKRQENTFVFLGFAMGIVYSIITRDSGKFSLLTPLISFLIFLVFYAAHYLFKILFNEEFGARITKEINESKYREVAFWAIYFLGILSILIILTVVKTEHYPTLSIITEAIFSLQVTIAKIGLIFSAAFLIAELIRLYRRNKNGDKNA